MNERMKYNKQSMWCDTQLTSGRNALVGIFQGNVHGMSDENDREECPENIQVECPRKLSGWDISRGITVWLTHGHTDSF